ncbi:hypothetical protein D3C75_850420 [compost metagenome]
MLLPGPPLLASDTPGTLRSSSGTEAACLRSISARSITVTAASDSLAVCAVRLAVTSSGSIGSASAAREKGDTPHSRMAAGVRTTLLIAHSLHRAHPRDQDCRRHAEDMATNRRNKQGKPPTRRVAPSAIPWMRQAGLRACEWNRSSRSRAFPCLSTVANSDVLTRLPLRGQRRPCV